MSDNGERASSGEVPTEEAVDQLWGKLMVGSIGGLSGFSWEFAQKWGERLPSGGIAELQGQILDKSRQEAKGLVEFLEGTEVKWLDEPSEGEWNFEEVRLRIAAVRFLMYGAAHLQVRKAEKMVQEGKDLLEADKSEYAGRFLLSAFHEVTGFANWAICDAEMLKETGSFGFEEWKQGLTSFLGELVEYLGEERDIEKLVGKRHEIVRGISGTELSSVFGELEERFEDFPIEFELNCRELYDRQVAGDAGELYSVLRNMVGNAVEEQLKLREAGGVNVSVSLGDDGRSFEVVCVNEGQFPQKWLGDEGDVVVIGQTTKEGGSGMGLKIITDYVEKVGGDFKVKNLPDNRVEVRLRGVLVS